MIIVLAWGLVIWLIVLLAFGPDLLRALRAPRPLRRAAKSPIPPA